MAVKVRNKRSWAILVGTAALAPGWLIPRIIGTLAFLAAPSWVGLILIVSWWTIVPGLMVLIWQIRKRVLKSREKLP